MEQIKVIIFDLGNVLISFDHMIAAKKIMHLTDKSAKDAYDLFFDSGLTEDFETGKISSRDFFKRVVEALNLKIGYDEFITIWNEIFFMTEQNHAVYHLAKKLKERYTTVLLSNINELHFSYLKVNFPVFDAFHEIFLSYALKLRKPDPLIYRHILDKYSVSPQEVVYIDDRQDLIQSATGLGIKSLTFTGIEKLKLDLKNSNLAII